MKRLEDINPNILIHLPPIVFTLVMAMLYGPVHLVGYLLYLPTWGVILLFVLLPLIDFFESILIGHKYKRKNQEFDKVVMADFGIDLKVWKQKTDDDKNEFYWHHETFEKMKKNEIYERLRDSYDSKTGTYLEKEQDILDDIYAKWRKYDLNEKIATLNEFEQKKEREKREYEKRAEQRGLEEKEKAKQNELKIKRLSEEELAKKKQQEILLQQEQELKLQEKLKAQEREKAEAKAKFYERLDTAYKERVKQEILEKERKKALESEAIRELIEDGKLNHEFSQQYKRDPIPSHVKEAVWKRDEGACVNCGSRAQLEFDHVIPVSKGGGCSVNNIQLLCFNCNRKKSNKVI
jgi:hypothetical protein